MIYVRTIAYNAGNTLRRAVDSILNQIYTDFTYYLCDNGSTDGGCTRRLVQEYALQDKRIVPFYNEENFVWHNGTEAFRDLARNIEENDYYCVLDADDEYLPTFLEEMLAFMDKYDLDIAACGSDCLSVDDNNKLLGQRLLTQNLILEGTDFRDYFTFYHQFLRTTWGKLSKGKTMVNAVTDGAAPGFPRAYGGDTYTTMITFRDAKRVGILSRSLHKYYVSTKSSSYVLHPERVRNDQILHKAALDYLKPFGEISPGNEDFLYAVYLSALNDTLKVLLNADIPTVEKLKGLIEMLSCKYTKKLIAKKNFGIYIGQAHELQQFRKSFFEEISKWLLSLNEVPDEQVESYCAIGELACAAAEYPEGWVSFNKLSIRIYMEQGEIGKAKTKLEELKELLPNDKEICELSNKLPSE